MADSYSQLVDAAYASGAGGAGWTQFLDAVAAATKGQAVLRIAPRHRLRDAAFLGATLCPDRMASYGAYYAALDPWSALDARGLAPQAVVVDEDLVPMAEVEAGEFYNDWLKPQALKHVARCRVATPGGRALDLLLLRPGSVGGYSTEEQAFCRSLLPHIKRAVEVSDRLGASAAELAILRSGFERSGAGLMIVDSRARIRSANAVADAILRDADGLASVGGRLLALGAEESRLIRSIHGATTCGGSRAAELLSVPRRAGAALSIAVSPLDESHATLQSGGPFALVIVNAPEMTASVAPERLQSLYGLTRSEARMVLALCAGQSIADYAAASAIRLTTAKTHLRSVFEKTGHRRQAELVSRIATDAALRLAP